MSQPVDTAFVEILPEFGRFAATLKRDLDRALRGMVGEFDRAFSAAEREAAQAGRAIGDEFERGGESAERALREVDRTSGRAFGNVKKDAAKAGGALAGLGGIASKIGLAAAGAAAVAGLGGIATAGLKAAASLEQSQIQFNSLLGSAKEGTRVFKELQAFAAATPFEFTDLTGAAARFLAFNQAIGMTDAQLIPFLTTLGDLASVTSAGAFGMDRAALALGQIASKGKVSLEEINQVNEAFVGFSGVAAIAAATGMTTAEAMEAISAGEINAEVGVQALLKGMQQFQGAAGAMEAQSQTLLGVFSTFKDTLSQSLAGAFTTIIPALKDSLAELTPILGEAVGVLAPAIGGVLTQLVKGIGPLLMPLAKIIGITIDALSPFLDIIILIVTEVADQLVPVFEELGPVIAELAPVILELVVALLPLVPALAQILIAGITLAAMLSKVLAPILSFLIKVGIAPAIQIIGIAFEFLAEAVRQFAVFMMQAPWGKIFGAIGDGIKKLGAEAVAFFVGLFAGFVRLKNEAVAAFNRLWTAARDAVMRLIREAIALPGAFRRALGNLGTLLVEKGKDLIRGLWNGIIAMGGWLRDKINGFVQNYLVGPLKSFLGIASPSKLMADEVGKWIPPGIVEGAQDAAGPLTTMINGLIGGGDAGGGAASGMGGGGFNFSPGSIIIQFSGVIPTATEAMGVGEAVGQGIARSISRRNTAAAVRMM